MLLIKWLRSSCWVCQQELPLTERRRKHGILNAPPELPDAFKGPAVIAVEVTTKSRKAPGDSSDCMYLNGRLVLSLLESRCPPAISGLVAFGVVDSVNGASRSGRSHVFQKSLKDLPTFAYSYSFASVLIVFGMVWSMAAAHHRLPCPVSWGELPSPTVPVYDWPVATAALGDATYQVVNNDAPFGPTPACAGNHDVSFAVDLFPRNGPPIEFPPNLNEVLLLATFRFFGTRAPLHITACVSQRVVNHCQCLGVWPLPNIGKEQLIIHPAFRSPIRAALQNFPVFVCGASSRPPCVAMARNVVRSGALAGIGFSAQEVDIPDDSNAIALCAADLGLSDLFPSSGYGSRCIPDGFEDPEHAACDVYGRWHKSVSLASAGPWWCTNSAIDDAPPYQTRRTGVEFVSTTFSLDLDEFHLQIPKVWANAGAMNGGVLLSYSGSVSSFGGHSDCVSIATSSGGRAAHTAGRRVFSTRFTLNLQHLS